jgi:hypothetical protein
MHLLGGCPRCFLADREGPDEHPSEPHAPRSPDSDGRERRVLNPDRHALRPPDPDWHAPRGIHTTDCTSGSRGMEPDEHKPRPPDPDGHEPGVLDPDKPPPRRIRPDGMRPDGHPRERYELPRAAHTSVDAPPNGEAQPTARRVQRCEPPRAVGTRRGGKSPRQGGRLQRVLGGAAGVDASRSAHISCNASGSAFHTAKHGKNQPCQAVKPGAKRDVERRRSMRTPREEHAVEGRNARVGRRLGMEDGVVRAAHTLTSAARSGGP